MNVQQNFSLQRDTLIATPYAPFRLAILRPIFHVMKNAGRVILEECEGQARKLAARSNEQLIYRERNSNFSK